MLSVTPAGMPAMSALSARVLLCTAPTDMRRSFDTLAGMIRQHLGHNPLSGAWFVFRSRRGDRVKIMYWDRDGYALWYKRLEKGTFRFPESGDGSAAIEVSPADLLMLLDGVDLRSVRRSERFALTPASPA